MVSPHKYIKNASTHITILTEHLLNFSRRLQTPKRTRKIPLQPGGTKERKKEKRNQKRDQQPWQEAEGEERSLHSETPLMVGKSAGTERGLWWIKGECSGWSVEGRTK